jgi:hypothetical protein
MNIIGPILVDVYKHFKIIHAQPRPLQIDANTNNVKHPLRLDLGSNNPQDLSSYKLNIRKLYLMGFPPSQRVFALLFCDFLDPEMG